GTPTGETAVPISLLNATISKRGRFATQLFRARSERCPDTLRRNAMVANCSPKCDNFDVVTGPVSVGAELAAATREGDLSNCGGRFARCSDRFMSRHAEVARSLGNTAQ